MKKEQECYGQHPMTKEQIDAFMSTPSKYGVPPVEVTKEDQLFAIPQIIQILANAGGYEVLLIKK